MVEHHQVVRDTRIRKAQRTLILILAGFCILANGAYVLLEKYSPETSVKVFGFYQRYVFPIISTPFAFLTDKLPFSLGEMLIIAAVIILPLSLIAFITLMIVKRKNRDFRRGAGRVYMLFLGWVAVYVLLTETLGCYVLYHGPTFAEQNDYPQDTYTAAQLEQLADFLIIRTNDLSMQVKRDTEGKFILTADLDDTAKAAMKELGERYPQLGGYYATPKAVKNSFFMSQQYLMGVYFPFTMEANYNDEMYSLNAPDTVCHELAHTKGYIREDEASFIAFLACDGSDNIDYRYSGYIRALKFVLEKCEQHCSEKTVSRLYNMLSDGVRIDWNSNSEYWSEVQQSDEGLFDSEKVAEVSDKAMEASLKLGGVEDGKQSYGRMTDLLLDWYFSEQG